MPKGRRGHAFTVLALISFATMLNYADRAVLGVAAPAMTAELSISPAVDGRGLLGLLLDLCGRADPGRHAARPARARGSPIRFRCILWSVFTLLHGFAAGVAALIVFRLGLGVAEAPCFPTNSRVLCTWFPQHERARANGVYSVGQYFGLAFLSPLLFWIVAVWGWRALFVIVGAIGIVFGVIWYLAYREPARQQVGQSGRARPHRSRRRPRPSRRAPIAFLVARLSASCCASARSSARRSASSAATRPWSSS